MDRLYLPLLAALAASGAAMAGEPWIPPGDLQSRHDLQMLVDDGVIDLPVSGWPIAVSDVAHALSKLPEPGKETPAATPAEPSFWPGRRDSQRPVILNAAQAAAVARLKRLASKGRWSLVTEVGGAARPTQLRTFDDTPREEGEFNAWASGFFGERWGARLEFTAVTDPEDDNIFRADGSYVAGKFGNWIVTLGEQERWWGSGWEGSLILSNSARPVPAIALDRAVSDPFETKWLSWIGPWRLTTFMGYMEAGREDFDHPLLFGFRISARPLDGLELSIERTAQWCGEGRSCDGSDFWNLWWGNDNQGENVDPEDEPGNQLAGWDIRWASPIGDWNYALYNQHTGETIDNQIPRPYRSMDIAGIETWGDAGAGGASWRAGFEWANTRCGGTENEQRIWDCAYNNGIFDVEGYRSKGRPLGHSMDGDGQMYSLRYVRVDASTAMLSALLRYTMANEGGVVPDTRNTLAPGPEDWWSADLSYRYPLRTGWIEAGAGVDYQDRAWNDTQALLPRAWFSWRHEFR
jgi:hypothetical protein